MSFWSKYEPSELLSQFDVEFLRIDLDGLGAVGIIPSQPRRVWMLVTEETFDGKIRPAAPGAEGDFGLEITADGLVIDYDTFGPILMGDWEIVDAGAVGGVCRVWQALSRERGLGRRAVPRAAGGPSTLPGRRESVALRRPVARRRAFSVRGDVPDNVNFAEQFRRAVEIG